MNTKQTPVSVLAGRRAPAWFADVRVNEDTGNRWITAEIKLRTPDGGMARGLGAAVRNPGDQSNLAHRLAIARALRDLARLVAASAADRK